MTKRIIAYISLFALLINISACTTTEQFSDTPEKVFSGKSDFDLKEPYSLDSVSLKNKGSISLTNYVINFTERQKERYLLYHDSRLKVIDYALMKETNSKDLIYKKPVADTLNLNAIDSMYFSRRKTDASYAILGAVFGIPIALFLLGYLFLRIDLAH